MAAEAKIRISVDSRQAETGAKRVKGQFDSLKSSAFAVGSAIVAAFSVRAIVRFGSALFGAAAKMDTMRRSLRAVIPQTEDLQESLETLRELAKAPGLTFDAVLDAAIRLRAVKLSAEDSNNAIREFGNALAAVGRADELGGVALALGQIVSKGTVSAEEINQIAERLPQIRTAMQSAFGTANTEAIQKLGITGEEFIRRVTGALSELERATAGPADKVAKLGDKLEQLKAKFGEAFAPAVVKGIDAVANAIDRLTGDTTSSVDMLDALARKMAGINIGGLSGFTIGDVQKLSSGLGDRLNPVGEFADVTAGEAEDRRRLAQTRRTAGQRSALEDAIFANAFGPTEPNKTPADPLAFLNFEARKPGNDSAAAAGAISTFSKLAQVASLVGSATTTRFSDIKASSLARIGGGGRVSGGTPITSRLDKQVAATERTANATEETRDAVKDLNFEMQ